MRFVLALGVLATAAGAQEVSVDAALVRACHAGAALGETRPSCVGAAAAACQALPGGDTTLGISECLMAETAVWAGLMQAAYDRQVERLGQSDPSLPESLRNSQAAWMAYRDAECGLRYHVWLDGSIRVIIAGNCHLEKTAARAQELRDLGAME